MTLRNPGLRFAPSGLRAERLGSQPDLNQSV